MQPSGSVTIRRLDALTEEQTRALVDILLDCVERGASVGFMAPLTRARAVAFWQQVGDRVAAGGTALLVAEDGDEVVGTVQLVLDLPENQPHRADVAKMLVHGRARRRGIGEQLMRAAEQVALDEGRTLLVLDAVTGGDAARLYARLGWQRVGEIPDYALWPNGGHCSTTYFYKALT